MQKLKVAGIIFIIILIFQQCSKDDTPSNTVTYKAVEAVFGGKINLNDLANYANQPKPNYIVKDNSPGSRIADAKATLGRVLFYDKQLSIDNSISCGSCHKQVFAFSDTSLASKGVDGGLTNRHSMRLINAKFANENRFFWDERANTLEEQTTQPIQDHAEMGFSGKDGRPGFANLITKLQGLGYYNELFQFVYGSATITEQKMQECLSQFIRSIQSFDARYDEGRVTVGNDNQNFPNFTAQENAGKNLFLSPPVFDGTGNRIAGGLGCNGCHQAPEFDIAPNSGNNGIIGILNKPGIDINNTRTPTLRDLTGTDGNLHTALMHTANFTTLQSVIGHYGTIMIAPGNTRLDPKLRPNGFGQQLHLTANEVNAMVAFLKTLSGKNVYTDAKWSDPF